jgi:single-strand DNA-binding protein
MLGQAKITVIGNVTNEPELRFTPSGAAVVTLSVADNPRRKNNQTGEWDQGDSTFYRVQAWRQQAENIAESVNKGDRVVVVGDLQNRRYEGREGEVRFSLEINADAVALDTRWAIVKARKAERQQGGQQQGQQGGWSQQGGQQQSDPWSSPPPNQGQQQRQQQPPQSDPWTSSPPPSGQQQGMWPEEPPF